MSNEQKPFTWDKKKVLALLILLLTLSLVVIYRGSRVEAIPTTKADNPKFVLASWDYPDEYGQGVLQIQTEENSTGAWEPVELRKYNESQEYEWNASVAIRLRLWTWLNNSVVHAIDLEDGENYQRLNVIVTNNNGTTVFSQQNFTFFVSYDTYDPMWDYQHYVVLDFLPDFGQTYKVTINYDVFYSSDYSLLDSDTSPAWNGIWEPEGSDGIDDNIFYSLADEDDDEDGAIETGITVNNELGTVMFNLDLTITAYSKLCASIAITVMLWSGVGSGSEEIVYSDSLTGTGAVNISGSTSLPIIESFLVNITYVGVGGSGSYVNMTIDSYSVEFATYDWYTISNLKAYFSPPLMTEGQQWLFDFSFVILGICMIPISTLYLAYGVKHDRSSDRLFFGIMIFVLGWAFVIAGIMP